MCSLFLEENEIIFTIFIEDYCGKARRAFVTLRMNSNKKSKNCVIKFLGENPGACPWDEAKKYFSKSLMSISSEYTLQI